MGKGDKKTRRGKINIGSYGVRRRRVKGRNLPIEAAPVVEVKPEKAVEPKVKKAAKAPEPVEPVVETAKKAPRKTAKKAKEEPASE